MIVLVAWVSVACGLLAGLAIGVIAGMAHRVPSPEDLADARQALATCGRELADEKRQTRQQRTIIDGYVAALRDHVEQLTDQELTVAGLRFRIERLHAEVDQLGHALDMTPGQTARYLDALFTVPRTHVPSRDDAETSSWT